MDKLINHEDGQVLELACGTGRLTNYATHALDASKEMMAHAIKRHKDVIFKEASATDTGFDSGSFNTVFTFHFLMHIDEQTIRQVFEEVHRILKPGGRFIFDIPSKSRRQLLHHKQASWHGATDMDKKDVLSIINDKYSIRRRFGIMMLPVHKLPNKIRKPLIKFDYLLANSFLKKYSSYQVFELQKL